MERRRPEHERLPKQAGALRRAEPREKQDVPVRSPVPLEVLAVKEEEEKSGGDHLSTAVVDYVMISDESDSDSDSNENVSMTKGSNQMKLTGKKRTADVFQEDSPVDAGEDQERIVEGDQAGGSSKQRFKDVIVRCEPKTIRGVVAKLNARQREKVKELGFGWLFNFNMDSFGSRELIVWLMDHLDPDTMILDFGGNRKLHITEHTVWCVLGLHWGDLDPSLSSNKLNLLSLRQKLGVPEGKNLEITFLVQKIQSGGTDELSMQCVMMVVLVKLLACTSSFYISQRVWNMVQDIDNFGNMNWCKFIVDHLIYSAKKWKKKKPDGLNNTVYGCSALLVMYYLDNLDCEQKMRCVEVPRAKFFGNGMVQKLMKADKLQKDDLATFGSLNLRNQKGTCYDERPESSRHVTAAHMPIPGTSDTDIVGALPMRHNQMGDSASHKSLCPRINKKAKQHHRQPDVSQIGDPEESREENEDGPIGYDDMQQTLPCNSSEFVHQQTDGDIAVATQGTAPSLEASAKFHGDTMVPGVPLGENAVTGGSEDGYRPVPVHSVQGAAEDTIQVDITSVKGQERNFMAGSSKPGILRSLDSLLPQIRESIASGVRASELEQEVNELNKKLSNKDEELRGAQSSVADAREELEAAIAKLRTAQASKLEAQAEAQASKQEAQAGIAAINSLALHLSATFVRLGSEPPSSDAIGSCTSLVEAVKLLKDQVSRIEPVSHGHATSLARRSVGFGAAALLCRGREKGVKALHDAVDADTRRFVLSQGPEFHALVDGVVEAVEQQHGDVPQVQAGRATRTAGTSS